MREAPGRLRVALDATPLIGPRTGVGAFTYGLLDGLTRVPDVEPTAYAVTWRGRGELGERVPVGVVVAGRPMPARPLRAAWARRGPQAPIEWWTGRIDVVHGTNFVVPPTRAAATLVTVHDLTPVRFPEMCTPDTLAYPALLARSLDRGAHVHCVSRSVADEVVALLGASPARVHVVHPGVPQVDAADPDEGKRMARAERYLLALGTVEPRKDFPSLVGAFDALALEHPDVALVLAGPNGWGAEALDAAVAASPHRARIRRLGWVDDRTRAALLRGATVLAYPSRYEGFGLPPLEAMSCGVAVVATDAGALAEVLGDAAVLVPVGDTAALAAALGSLLDDDDIRSEFTRRGPSRAARYSWERCASEMTALYRAIC